MNKKLFMKGHFVKHPVEVKRIILTFCDTFSCWNLGCRCRSFASRSPGSSCSPWRWSWRRRVAACSIVCASTGSPATWHYVWINLVMMIRKNDSTIVTTIQLSVVFLEEADALKKTGFLETRNFYSNDNSLKVVKHYLLGLIRKRSSMLPSIINNNKK